MIDELGAFTFIPISIKEDFGYILLNIYQENRLEAELFQPSDFLYANEEK